MGAKEVKWILDELPGLVESGVLSPENAERVRAHYSSLPVSRRLPLAIVLLAILGAVFTGLGIVLILASNWEQLSRPVRAVVAFIPLIAAQALAGYTILRRPDSKALREGGGVFLVLAVAAGIALVGQTYNVPGTLAGFLFAWLWLTLPVGLLLQAVLPTALYMAIVVAWAASVQLEGLRGVLFWPLMLLSLPHLVLEWRRGPYAPQTVFLCWVLCAGLTIGTGMALVRTLPGLWVIVYGGLFATLYLVGRLWQYDWHGIWRRPFHTFGAGAIGILSLILTFEWPWEGIGWRHYRTQFFGYGFYVAEDYILAIALPLAAVALLAMLVLRGRPGAALFGSSIFVVVAGFALATEVDPDMAAILFSVYLLVLGVGTLAAGLRSGRLQVVNGGMFLLAALIVARFFDTGVSFAVRGLAFVVLGLVFLGTNVALWRHGTRTTGGAA